MPIARASIIAGPALVTFNGQTLFSKDDVKVTTKVQTFDVKTMGKPTMKREENVQIEVSFTPNGVWGTVYPLIQAYAGMAIGTDIFGATDTPLVIHSIDGYTYTYSAAALTKLPTITFSGGKTLFGALTFTCLGADNTAPTTANRRVTLATGVSYTYPDGYDPSQIVTQGYTLSWGAASDWQNLDTEDGITVDFALSLSPKKVDSTGIIGMRYTDMVVTAKAKPVGALTPADVLAGLDIQGSGAGRGRSLATTGLPLVITGTGVYAELYAAAITDAGDTFGAENNRIDTITWEANSQIVSTALKPLFYLSTSSAGA